MTLPKTWLLSPTYHLTIWPPFLLLNYHSRWFSSLIDLDDSGQDMTICRPGWERSCADRALKLEPIAGQLKLSQCCAKVPQSFQQHAATQDSSSCSWVFFCKKESLISITSFDYVWASLNYRHWQQPLINILSRKATRNCVHCVLTRWLNVVSVARKKPCF